MFSLLRRLKLAYSVYNFFRKKELLHNLPLYRKLGLKKKYYSPVSSRDFRKFGFDEEKPVNTEALRSCAVFREADEFSQQSMLNYDQNGYCIIRGLFEKDTLVINSEIDSLLERGLVKFGYGGKIMFAIHQSKLLSRLATDTKLTALLDVFMKGRAVLFQSINFIKGSEQDTHSDSIHMTSFPPGGLLGVWIALEDINMDNGPLHYYPGSHKLPYYMNADYGNEGNRFLLGRKSYKAYEKMIAEKIADQRITKEIFTARRGDVLIWHANLFHGGEPHLDKHKSRKSMVLHYFREGSICYHEITQRPALIKAISKE